MEDLLAEPLGPLNQPLPYLNNFVDYFVERGYERGKTIRAAPYDWRLAAGTYPIWSTEHLLCSHGSCLLSRYSNDNPVPVSYTGCTLTKLLSHY